MTALLETLIPTVGDLVAALVLLALAAVLVVTVAAARDLEDELAEPEPPPRPLPSAFRVLPAAPFDWQHETDL